MMSKALDRKAASRTTGDPSTARTDLERPVTDFPFAVPVPGLTEPVGHDADGGVRVHYNSAEPARLHARAFARGRDIHLAPGQNHALPHELWHLAQQHAGRVRVDGFVNGTPVSLDPMLERE